MSKAKSKEKNAIPQRKMIYEETYKKGALFMNDLDRLNQWLRQEGVTREVMKAGKNNDGTEFVVLKINGFNP